MAHKYSQSFLSHNQSWDTDAKQSQDWETTTFLCFRRHMSLQGFFESIKASIVSISLYSLWSVGSNTQLTFRTLFHSIPQLWYTHPDNVVYFVKISDFHPANNENISDYHFTSVVSPFIEISCYLFSFNGCQTKFSTKTLIWYVEHLSEPTAQKHENKKYTQVCLFILPSVFSLPYSHYLIKLP